MIIQFKWTAKQKDILQATGFPYDTDLLDEGLLADLEETVGEHLQLHGLANHDKLNEIGLTCESILDEIAKV